MVLDLLIYKRVKKWDERGMWKIEQLINMPYSLFMKD